MNRGISKKRERGIFRRAGRALFLAAGCALLFTGCGGQSAGETSSRVRIGVTLYDQYDTFVAELMEEFGSFVEGRKAGGVDIVTVVRDAAGSQKAQNDEVREMIENGCGVVCVNLVDRTAID